MKYFLKYQSTVFNDDRYYMADLGESACSLKNKILMYFKKNDVNVDTSSVVIIQNDKVQELLSSFELKLLMVNCD